MNHPVRLTLLLAMFGTPVQAGLIFQPTAVEGSSFSNPVFDGQFAGDQSGLSAGYTSGVDDFDTILGSITHSAIAGNVGWASRIAPTLNNDPNGAGAEFLRVDLGQIVNIERLGIWMELREDFFSTTNEFEVFSSADNTFTNLNSLGIFNAPLSPGNGGHIFDITDASTQFVLLNVRSLHATGLNPHASFGEIAFDGTLDAVTASVPEPSSFVLLLASAVILVVVVARRRTQPAQLAS